METISYYCASVDFGYFCDKNGMIQHNGLYLNAGCSAHCKCEKIDHPGEPCTQDKSCPPNGAGVVTKSIDTNSIGNDFPEFGIHIRTDLKARTQFALVCNNDKFLTDLCQESPWDYYCSVSGRFSQKPKGVTDKMCVDKCRCVNMLGVVCSPVFLNACKAVDEADLPGPSADKRTVGETDTSEDDKITVVDADRTPTKIEFEQRDDWTLNC